MTLAITDFVLSDPGGGGANEKVKGDAINDNQSAPPSDGILPLKNCHTNTVGSIVKRKGYTKYAGQLSVAGSPSVSMEEITGMFQYTKYDTTQYEVVCASSGGTVGIFDISTPGSPVEIQGAASVTDDTLFSFFQLNNTLVLLTEDRDTPLKWTGSGNVATLGGSPPAGKYGLEFENYGFIANTSTNPNRVYWSGLADAESWTATDFKRLPGACTGLGVSGNDLFFFTQDSITLGRFTGDAVAPFTFDQLDTRVGCASHRSIVNKDGILYWMGADGHVYRMNGLNPERVTELIPLTKSRFNTAVLDRCVAVDHRELNQLWFCVGIDGSSYNDFVVAYDYLKGEIFFYDGMSINAACNFLDSTGAIKTYFGDRDGYIYLTNNGHADNPSEVETAIDFYRYTKQFNFGSPSRIKRVRKIKATVNNSSTAQTTFALTGDFGSTSGEVVTITHDAGDVTIGTFVVGTSKLGGVDEIEGSNDTATTSKYVHVKIANAQLNTPIEIRDISMYYQTYGRE